MQTLSTTEVARQIGRVTVDVQREPINVTVRGRTVAVMMSREEFALLRTSAGEAEPSLEGETCYACGAPALLWSQALAVPGVETGPARLPACSSHWRG